MEKLPIQQISSDSQGRFFAFASGSEFHVLDTSSNSLVQSEDLKSNAHSDTVRTIQFDSEGKYLVTAGDDKKVRVFDTKDWKCVASRTHGKKISTVVFGPSKVEGNDSKLDVWYADKFGDVYGGPVNKLEDANLMLGHCSTVCYMILSPKNDYILTCDRDEKIRVSHYPASYDIESFCLGHTSLVSRLVIPKQATEYLVSGGSDGTLRLWEYTKGNLLQTLQVPPNSTTKSNIMSLSFSEKELILAAVVEGHNSVLLYKLDTDKKELTHFQSLAFGVESQLIGAQFNSEGTLFAHGRNPQLLQFKKENDSFVPVNDSPLVAAVLSQVKEVPKQNLEKLLKAISLESIRKLDGEEFQNNKKARKEAYEAAAKGETKAEEK